MSAPQYVSKRLVTFASAPAAGQNTGCLLEVGTAAPYSLFFDNGSALVPIDLQGDWAGRTVADTDSAALRTLAANDNVLYLNYAAAGAFTFSTTPTQPLNKLVEVVPIGTAAVTITAGSGVTFVGPYVSGGNVVTTGAGRAISFIQRSANTWQVIGGAPAPTPIVAFKTYAGSAQSIGAGFTTVVLNSTPAINIGGGGWDGTYYTIPVKGQYHCIATGRGDDAQSRFNLGIGVNTSNMDSSDFFWFVNNTTDSSANRNTMVYDNKVVFNIGDLVRLFMYVDSNGSGNRNIGAQSLSLQLAVALP